MNVVNLVSVESLTNFRGNDCKLHAAYVLWESNGHQCLFCDLNLQNVSMFRIHCLGFHSKDYLPLEAYKLKCLLEEVKDGDNKCDENNEIVVNYKLNPKDAQFIMDEYWHGINVHQRRIGISHDQISYFTHELFQQEFAEFLPKSNLLLVPKFDEEPKNLLQLNSQIVEEARDDTVQNCENARDDTLSHCLKASSKFTHVIVSDNEGRRKIGAGVTNTRSEIRRSDDSDRRVHLRSRRSPFSTRRIFTSANSMGLIARPRKIRSRSRSPRNRRNSTRMSKSPEKQATNTCNKLQRDNTKIWARRFLENGCTIEKTGNARVDGINDELLILATSYLDSGNEEVCQKIILMQQEKGRLMKFMPGTKARNSKKRILENLETKSRDIRRGK